MAEPIEGIKLNDLVEQVSEALVEERKKSTMGMIREMFLKYEGIVKEIKNLTQQLRIKEEQKTKIEERIAKLKTGDWSVIQEKQTQTQQKTDN